MDDRFSHETSELNSAAATLEDLRVRVINAAARFQSANLDDAVTDCYEVERNITAATRRLDVLLRRLNG